MQRKQGVVVVTVKGNRTRVVPFLAPEVDNALRRYERAHANASKLDISGHN